MLKQDKLDFQRDIETYLEEHKVFDIFQSIIEGIIVETPQDPVKFIIDKMGDKTSGHKVIILGPPRCSRKEHALSLSEHFNQETVSVGDLLSKEINKKMDLGKKIITSKEKSQYVEDEIVIELIQT